MCRLHRRKNLPEKKGRTGLKDHLLSRALLIAPDIYSKESYVLRYVKVSCNGEIEKKCFIFLLENIAKKLVYLIIKM